MGDGTEFVGRSSKYRGAWQYFWTANSDKLRTENISDPSTLRSFLNRQFKIAAYGGAVPNVKLVNSLVDSAGKRGLFGFKPKGEKFTLTEQAEIRGWTLEHAKDFRERMLERYGRPPTQEETKLFLTRDSATIKRNMRNPKKLGLVDIRLDKFGLGGQKFEGSSYEMALYKAEELAKKRQEERPDLKPRKPYLTARNEVVLVTALQYVRFKNQRKAKEY